MKVLDVIRTGNRNLSRAKLRTFLTISAIFVGAVTLTITTALGAGTQQYIDTQLGNVATPGVFFVTPKVDQENPFAGGDGVKEYDPNKNNATLRDTVTLKETDIDKLKTMQDVEFAKPYYSLKSEFVTVGDKKFANSSLTQYSGLNIDLSAGRVLKTDDKDSMLLPEKYLASLGFANAEVAIGKQVAIGYKNVMQQVVEKKFTVQGVLKKSILTEGSTYIDDASANDIAKDQAQTDNYFAAIVKFTDATDQNEAMYKDRVQNAGEYTATSMKEQIKTITDVVSAITSALNIIGIIALVAASFGIINTLLMSVYERTQEIGLMKALGMHRRTVFGLFAFEAILVGFWGSVAATIGAYFIALGVNQLATDTFLKGLDGFTLLLITPMNAVMVIGIIMLVAFLAGTLPAIKASRLNPIDALRSE